MIHPAVLFLLIATAFAAGWFASRLQFILSLRRSITKDPEAAITDIRRHFGDWRL